MGFKTIHVTAGNACGKTLSAIATAKMLLKTNPQYERVLIAAPEGLPDFFETELRTDLREGVTVTIVENANQISEYTKYDLVVDDLFSQLTRHPLLQYICHGGYLIETHSLGFNKVLRDALYDSTHATVYTVCGVKKGLQLPGRYNSTKRVIVELKSDVETTNVSIMNFPLTFEGVQAALELGLANQRLTGSLALNTQAFNKIIEAAKYDAVPSPELMGLVKKHIGSSNDNDLVKNHVLDDLGCDNWSPKTNVLEQINVAITELRNTQ